MSNQPGDPAVASRGDETAPGVGQLLRSRREQLGWSLPDVAVWLKIRLSYLEGLESGQLSRLPGNAYALGFLRTYAGTLGLDADDLSRRFRSEIREVNRRPELSFPAPVPERGVPAGAIVLLGALVIVGAYIGWYEFGSHERAQTHSIPPVPAAMLPGTAAKAPPSPQVATVMPNPNAGSLPVPANAPAAGTTTAPAATAGTTTEPGTALAAAGTTAGTASGNPDGTAAATPGSTAVPAATPADTATATPGAAGAAPAADDHIVVKATAQSWVQIRQDGKVAIDRVLKAGDTVDVPPGGPATLTTGNAGGVELVLGSVTTAPLGRFGAVRRNIALDPAAIRDGSVTASSSAAAGPAVPSGTAPAAAASATPAGNPDGAASDAGADGAAASEAARRPATHSARPKTDPSASDAATDALNAQQAKLHAPHLPPARATVLG